MIELVKFSGKHRDTLVRLLSNYNIAKWLLMVPYPYTYEDADFWINKCLNDYSSEDDFSYAIEYDGIHIGGIGLHRKFEH